MMMRMKRLRALAHQEHWPPCPPFLVDSAELVETLPPGDFLPLRWASFPLSKWGLFRQRCPTSPWHSPWYRSLLYWELEPSLWSGLASTCRRKGLRQTPRMSLCQRSINMDVQASLTRRTHLLKTVKKRELWSLNLTTLPGKQNLTNVLKCVLNFQLAWKQPRQKCHESGEVIHALQTQV